MARRVTMLIVLAGALMLAAACSTDSRSDQDDPTTRAMADPMNYSPSDQDEDISGGGLMEFHKDAFKKDMDRVLNP